MRNRPDPIRLAATLILFAAGPALAGGGVIDLRIVDLDGAIHRIGTDGGVRPAVLVLLDPACPISNRYTPDLAELAALADENGLAFYGVLSDPILTPAEGREFRDEAGIEFPILWDATGDLALRLGPSHVPEAFVVSVDDRVLYRGRIDDRFVSIGRMRRRITTRDLGDAIEAVGAGRAVAVARTEPVGCVFEAWTEALPEAVTYARHVAPILTANCVGCHREGEVAPFALDSHRDAARRARMLALVTADRIMPPWPADPDVGHFRDERVLSDRLIAILGAWAEAGAPEGEAADALPPADFPAGWRLGEPDAVVTMAEPYELPATGDAAVSDNQTTDR